jgi:membrane protein DedA with SNARE-associated domain
MKKMNIAGSLAIILAISNIGYFGLPVLAPVPWKEKIEIALIFCALLAVCAGLWSIRYRD